MMIMSRFFNNSRTAAAIAAGNIKKVFVAAALAVCCIMPLTLSVSASENNEIRLESNGGEAVLEVCFPQAAAEEIASMQMSVSVKANAGSVNLEFIPDSGLSSKIVESRYQNDTGVLNIYLAGTEALFSSSDFITVGRIKISTYGSDPVSAAVEVVKDSVRFVRDGELVSPDSNTDYPASVSITALGQSSPDISYPVNPEQSSGNYFPNIPALPADDNSRYEIDETQIPVPNDGYTDGDADEDRYDDTGLENQDTVGENINPPDTSALMDALSKADGYRKTDYTEKSYGDLKEAADNAKKLISDPNATQDEIDEALLNIENAIGMLQLANDIPSGAEGYGGNDGYTDGGVNNGVSGESAVIGGVQVGQPSDGENAGHDGSGSDVQAAQGGNIVNASDEARHISGDPFTENGESSKSPVFKMIVIAAIAVVAAAAAIIFLKRASKKKDGNGDRFKN